MPLRRLEPGQIHAGLALPCDIRDRAGRLMLKAGQVIPNDHQVERLIAQGIYGDLDHDAGERAHSRRFERESVYARLGELRAAVAEAADAALAGNDRHPLAATYLRLAGCVMELCGLEADAALGSVQLQRPADHSARQAVNVSIVAELLLVQRGVDTATRLPLLAAALTMNLAMRDLQNQLYAQSEPLTDGQKRAVRNHPQQGADLLAARGVTEPTWLATVAQHHELLDGSGYPEGLTGARVAPAAQVVGMADRYCAMVTERAYRPGVAPNSALREIFLAQGRAVDPMLAAQMVKELGIYPPGALVQLASGETAVVVKRSLNASQPIVRAILSASGIRLPALPKRRTSHPSFAIAQVLPRARMPGDVEVAALWATSVSDDSVEEPASD